MKWIKTFENFSDSDNDEEKKKLKKIGYNLDESIKVKNITEEDVIKTIKGGGKVFATIIKDFPNNDPKEPLTPVSIDGDGLVTVSYDGKEYEVDIKNIEKIDIPVINEGIDVDWSKPYKEIEKSVLNEINRIFKKTKSDVWRSSFSNKDLEWSDTPSEDYEYKDGKLVKVGEKKVFLRFSNSIREELNILEEIEEIYDDLSEKFMGIIDMLNFDASFELAWDYGPKFKEVEYVDFGVTFNFEKLDMPSYGKSLQNISSLIGNENITYWTNSDKKLTVYFRHKK